jgi:cobalamin biosynthetic protein CobC
MAAREHGGNMDAAMAQFGGARADWLDLSTGINPTPYPLPDLSAEAWTALPTKSEIAGLVAAAGAAYRTKAACLPTAGAQAGIQMIPRILPRGVARVLTPTYNEHAASLTAAGWQVAPAADLSDLAGADLAVVVNPNNPDGRMFAPSNLRIMARTVGHLLVDESFGDPHPELSLAPDLDPEGNVTVLRSFGKFYGLAGVRLGFVLGPDTLITQLTEFSGPWPISGAAIAVGRAALLDSAWQAATTATLEHEAARLDDLAQEAGWKVLGGTTLFRLYDTPDTKAAQAALARSHVWSRIFPYSKTWLRLGLPPQDRWDQVTTALTGASG